MSAVQPNMSVWFTCAEEADDYGGEDREGGEWRQLKLQGCLCSAVSIDPQGSILRLLGQSQTTASSLTGAPNLPFRCLDICVCICMGNLDFWKRNEKLDDGWKIAK